MPQLRRRLRRVIALALLAASVLAGASPPAFGHATLLESTPRPGARLADPPSRIVLVYSEPLNDRLTELRLLDAVTGRRIAARRSVVAGRRLELRPSARLEQGAYRVDWRSVSTIDGHVRDGSVGFGVGTAALAAATLKESPLDGAGPARAIARWLFYAALFFFAGGVLNAALLGRGRRTGAWLLPEDPRARLAAAGLDAHAVATRAIRRTLWAGWLAAAGAVAVVALETLEAAGASLRGAGDFLLSSSAGVSRIVLVAALVAAAGTAVRHPHLSAALIATALMAIAQGGHAAGAEPAVLAVVTDWLHLVAAAVWIGGIAQLAWTWVPELRDATRELRRAVLRSALSRFGRVAMPAFLVVAVTGLINALVQLGAVRELWATGYGRVLAVKILLVAALAALSYLHALRLRPRLLAERPGGPQEPGVDRAHRRLIAGEPPVGAAILAAAALLVGFPVPPRELREAQARAVVPACDPCPFARPQPGELPVAAPVGRLTAAAWLRRDEHGVSGTLRVIDGQRRPAAVEATIAHAADQRKCGIGCWRFRTPSVSTVQVALRERNGGRHVARLPARWDPRGDDRARRIIAAAQRTMRRLGTFSQAESVRSAVAPGHAARSRYRFQAPDRADYETATARSIIIGRRSWIHANPQLGWQPIARAEEPFRVRDGFRWTVFQSTARLIAIHGRRGRRTAEVALLDWGYPVWYRVMVDLGNERVVRQTLVTPENRIEDRYFGFDRPVDIGPPPSTAGG